MQSRFRQKSRMPFKVFQGDTRSYVCISRLVGVVKSFSKGGNAASVADELREKN